MAEIRHDFRVDVTAVLPPGAAGGPVEIAATLIADPETVGGRPTVIIGIPGGTYHRRYTVVVVPAMAHMHSFADTRERLWDRFYHWLPAVTGAPART